MGSPEIRRKIFDSHLEQRDFESGNIPWTNRFSYRVFFADLVSQFMVLPGATAENT